MEFKAIEDINRIYIINVRDKKKRNLKSSFLRLGKSDLTDLEDENSVEREMEV